MDGFLFGFSIGIVIGAVFGVICTVLFLAHKFPVTQTESKYVKSSSSNF